MAGPGFPNPIMDPIIFGLGTLTGAGALWSIRRLYRLRPPTEGLGDLLGWAFLIDEGIILMKDGSFLSGFELKPPDLDTISAAEANSVTDTVHDMLMLLGEGYGIEMNVRRSHSTTYPIPGPSDFPTVSLELMERERQRQYEQRGSHYCLQHNILLTYTPPKEMWSKWELPMIHGSRTELDYTQILSGFKQSMGEVQSLLASRFRVTPLCSKGMLTECHSALTGQDEHVESSPNSYLSHTLASDDFQTGFYPILGGQHLFVVTISSLGAKTKVAEGAFMNRIPFHGRWHMRFVGMNRHVASRRIKRQQTNWFHQRRGLRKLIVSGEEEFEDQDALDMQRETATAHAEASSGRVRFGYFTNTFILRHSEMQKGLAESQILLHALRDQGYTCAMETINATDAFIGSLPGHGYANLRRPLLSSRNIAHLFPVSTPWQGNDRCPSPLFPDGSSALACTRTSGGVPFLLNLHQGDVGHTLVIGATGAGKSVLVGWIALNFLRYPQSRVHIFDVGRSHQIPCYAADGAHFSFGQEAPCPLQPLRHIHEENERLWALSWLETLYDLAQDLPDAENRLVLSETLNLLGQSHPRNRTLSALQLLLPESLRSTMIRYTSQGPYGNMFDGDRTISTSERMQVYELGHILDLGDSVIVPILLALFRRIERTLDGTPTLIVIEESWAALLRSRFAQQIKIWLLTLRKHNVAVLLVAHSPSQIMSLPNAGLITESCPTKIILPNPEAWTEKGSAMYRSLDLSARSIQAIAQAKPKRDYFYKSPVGSRLFELNLGPMARTLLMPLPGLNGEASRKRIQDAIRKHGHDFLHELTR